MEELLQHLASAVRNLGIVGLCVALMTLVFFFTWKALCWAIILIVWVIGLLLDLLGLKPLQ